MVALCGGTLNGLSFFPFLSDPARRSTFCLKLALVMMHLTFVGVLFGFDKELIHKTIQDLWYTTVYLLLLVATLAQYFITSGSSPGYVLDAMRAINEIDASHNRASSTPTCFKQKLQCSYYDRQKPVRKESSREWYNFLGKASDGYVFSRNIC